LLSVHGPEDLSTVGVPRGGLPRLRRLPPCRFPAAGPLRDRGAEPLRASGWARHALPRANARSRAERREWTCAVPVAGSARHRAGGSAQTTPRPQIENARETCPERRRPESNRCKRLCRPLRSHSATSPNESQGYRGDDEDWARRRELGTSRRRPSRVGADAFRAASPADHDVNARSCESSEGHDTRAARVVINAMQEGKALVGAPALSR
jgi:hypothetical protein